MPIPDVNMKAKFVTPFLSVLPLYLLTNLSAFAHKEPTHQFITREAYKLLTQHVGPIPIMSDYVGDTDGRNCSPIDSHFGVACGKIVAGVWMEDEQDIGYRIKGAFRSGSHFWMAGYSEEEPVIFVVGEGFASKEITPSHGLPNALQKFRRYRDGEFTIWYKLGSKVYEFAFIDIIDFFKTGGIYWNRSFDVTWGGNDWLVYNEYNVPRGSQSTLFETALGLGNDLTHRRGIAFNVLGRMAHLIQDLSVPSHVHNNQHACPPDLYEDVMNVDDARFGESFQEYWGATRTLTDRGGMLNFWDNCPTLDEGLFFLRNMGMVSTHYADWGWNGRVPGIDFSVTPVGDLFRASYGQGGPTLREDYWDHYNRFGVPNYCGEFSTICPCHDGSTTFVTDVRNYTVPYAIRATAGFLYWFAKRAGLLSDCGSNTVFVQNVVLSNNHLFEGASIVAGSNVDQTRSTGNVVSNSVAHSLVTFRAENEIVLSSGFSTWINTEAPPRDYAGANSDAFHAYIAPCSTSTCEVSSSIEFIAVGDRLTERLKTRVPSVSYESSSISQSACQGIIVSIGSRGNENTVLDDLLLLPIPAREEVKLKCRISDAGHFDFLVFNNSGEAVMLRELGVLETGTLLEEVLDVSQFVSGTYWLRLRRGDVIVSTARIVIKR